MVGLFCDHCEGRIKDARAAVHAWGYVTEAKGETARIYFAHQDECLDALRQACDIQYIGSVADFLQDLGRSVAHWRQNGNHKGEEQSCQ
jgi:hypothetical protein